MTPPTLLCGDPEKSYTIETDASDETAGGVLYQMQNGKKHPVAYESRKLKAAERNYPVHERCWLLCTPTEPGDPTCWEHPRILSSRITPA